MPLSFKGLYFDIFSKHCKSRSWDIQVYGLLSFKLLFYIQTVYTFWLMVSWFFLQVTVTSATYTFPCSLLLVSTVVKIILLSITSLESDFISSMILFKFTPLRSSGANDISEVGCWISSMIDPNNFLMIGEFIGWDHASLFSTSS